MLLVAWLGLGATTAGAAQADTAGLPIAAAIEARVAAVVRGEDLAIQGERIASKVALGNFYTARGFAPAWTDPRKVEGLLLAIQDSVADGLDPIDYHAATLERLRVALTGPVASDFERADFDVLMTDALVRLGYHVWFGKVDPARFDPGWNLSRTIDDLDPAAAIARALAADDLRAYIESEKPAHPFYRGLKAALARHRTIALAGGWPSIGAGPALKLGMEDARVPRLRERLALTGDLDAAYAQSLTDTDTSYDATVEAAVRRYQARNGLAADGVAGAGTLRELNVPVEQRIRQLRVNLDRGRVLLQGLPDKFVVVNIAGFEAWYLRGGEIAWHGRAQVGRAYRETPEYRSNITYLVFNPTWTVPPGIIRNDILPAAKRDPYSITRKGLNVIDSAGQIVDPASVDWSRYTSGHIPYTLRQDPGPTNALGRVKFMFPNPYMVYLHDTPSRSLFESAERLTSSGCVRIERPFELAELLLDDADKWSRQDIDTVIASGRIRSVTLREPVPVLLAYWTAWIDADGALQLRRDVYGRDEQWGKALDERFSFRLQPLGNAPVRRPIETLAPTGTRAPGA